MPRALERRQLMLEDVAVVLNFTRDALPPCVVLLAVVLRKRSRFKGFIYVVASQQPLLCKGVGAQIREWQPRVERSF